MMKNPSLHSTKDSVIISCVIIQDQNGYTFIYSDRLNLSHKFQQLKQIKMLNIRSLKFLLPDFLKSKFEKTILHCNKSTIDILDQARIHHKKRKEVHKYADFLRDLIESAIIDENLSTEFFLIKSILANNKEMQQTLIASNKKFIQQYSSDIDNIDNEKVRKSLIASYRKIEQTILANYKNQ